MAGGSARGWLVALLATLWGLRLGLHLGRRKLGHPEDRRYAAMRAARGPSFAVTSLFTVFLLQAALMWVISLPMQASAVSGGPLGLVDMAGSCLVLTGVAIEAIADAQLTRFLARSENRGNVMQLGLWAWSRHPNYFGDFVVWWGFGLVGLAAGAPWTLVGPLLMSVLLLRVSGVTGSGSPADAITYNVFRVR